MPIGVTTKRTLTTCVTTLKKGKDSAQECNESLECGKAETLTIKDLRELEHKGRVGAEVVFKMGKVDLYTKELKKTEEIPITSVPTATAAFSTEAITAVSTNFLCFLPQI